MAFLEALPLAEEALGAGEEAGAGGGLLRDFNDSPVGKMAGSSFGQKVMTSLGAHEVAKGIEGTAHTAESAIGTQPSTNVGGYILPD